MSAAIAVQHGTESEQPAGDWPITLVAISTFGLVRSQAESMPFLQNQDGEWHDHAVAHAEVGHFRSELDYFPHVLVAQDIAGFHRRLVALSR